MQADVDLEVGKANSAAMRCILATLLLLAVAVAAQGSESDPRLVRGSKVLKEGMELDAEQEQALPDTSGRFKEQ